MVRIALLCCGLVGSIFRLGLCICIMEGLGNHVGSIWDEIAFVASLVERITFRRNGNFALQGSWVGLIKKCTLVDFRSSYHRL